MHAALQQSDSATPIKEPRRACQALSGVFRHAVTKAARESAEMGDNVRLCAQVLASYICLHDSLDECSTVSAILDARNPCVSENASIREIEQRLNLHPVKKATGKDKFFNRLTELCEPVKASLNLDSLLGAELKGERLGEARNLLLKLLLVCSVRSDRLLALFLSRLLRTLLGVDKPGRAPESGGAAGKSQLTLRRRRKRNCLDL